MRHRDLLRLKVSQPAGEQKTDRWSQRRCAFRCGEDKQWLGLDRRRLQWLEDTLWQGKPPDIYQSPAQLAVRANGRVAPAKTGNRLRACRERRDQDEPPPDWDCG